MPIIPVTIQAPYSTADDVLNLTRSILNDAAQSLAGNLFADNRPYTFTLLNGAYQELQDELIDCGVETFAKEAKLLNYPQINTSVQGDPSVQTYINFSNSYDGVTLYNTPVLPQDLIIPVRLWERPSSSNFDFTDMAPVNDGLPTIPQTPYLRYWDWRGDAIYFMGALEANDIRIRYIAYLPALANGTDRVGIFRCENALASLTAWKFAQARGSQLAPVFKSQADEYIGRMTNRTARKKQRGSHRRKPYGTSNFGSFGGTGFTYNW